MKTSDHVLTKPRTESRYSKTRRLSPRQRQSLICWLKREKLTYAQARARLKKKFGISLAASTLSHFWRCHCAPLPPPQEILLDIVIQSATPVRLIIKRKANGISFSSATR